MSFNRDDFSPKFVALFTLLLFLKSFHWLAEDRVDFMERSPSISVLFHIRVLSLACLLASVDCLFISHAYYSTLTKGKKYTEWHTILLLDPYYQNDDKILIFQELRCSWYLASNMRFYLLSSSTH